MAKKHPSKRKRIWPLYVGIFCLLGSVVMSTIDITGMLFYLIVATCCLGYFFGRKLNEPVNISSGDYQEPAKVRNTKKIEYVINPTTMVVHRPSCRYAEKAYSFNKHSTDSLSAAISVGYKPCKYCKPK